MIGHPHFVQEYPLNISQDLHISNLLFLSTGDVLCPPDNTCLNKAFVKLTALVSIEGFVLGKLCLKFFSIK